MRAEQGKIYLPVVNVLLVCSSILIFLICLEWVLRWQGYEPLTANGRELILRPSEIEERIYEAIPNASGYAWDADIAINSAGFRDRQYPIAKPFGVHRVIVLGDSIAFGNKLPVKDVFPERLESLFADQEQPVEVLNLALGGYDTLQEVSTLEHVGLKFDPDVVILAYCINDIGVYSFNLKHIKKALLLRSSPLNQLRLAQFIHILLNRIVEKFFPWTPNNEKNFLERYGDYMLDVTGDDVLRKLIDALRTELGDGSEAPWFATYYTSIAHIGKLRFALEKLRTLQHSHDFDVLVTIIPLLDDTVINTKTYMAVNDILEHEFARVGFNTVYAFSDNFIDSDSLKIEESDVIHPNRLGHELIADQLFNQLQNSASMRLNPEL